MEIRATAEEMRKKKLFLATPMYGGNCSGMYTRSVADLTSLCVRHGIELKMYFLFNESLITRARAYCCDEFMRSDCTHLMFIDSDIGFDANDVIAMLALAKDDSPYDVIGGAYPKKTIAWEKIKVAVDKGFADENPNNLDKFVGDFVFNPKNGTTSFRVDEPVEVMEIGTGFMLIQRRTLETYRQKFSTLSYRPDHVRTANFDGSREIMMYFDCVIDRGYDFEEVHALMKQYSENKVTSEDLKTKFAELLEKESKASRRYLSEDYKFCHDCNKMGLKVWLCPWIKLNHVGSYVFGGSLPDLASLGVAATADADLLNSFKKG